MKNICMCVCARVLEASARRNQMWMNCFKILLDVNKTNKKPQLFNIFFSSRFLII